MAVPIENPYAELARFGLKLEDAPDRLLALAVQAARCEAKQLSRRCTGPLEVRRGGVAALGEAEAAEITQAALQARLMANLSGESARLALSDANRSSRENRSPLLRSKSPRDRLRPYPG
jgi:hypothetical protein